MCCMLCIIIFFFKQKTAYELRISDWSSDVCSSDLSVSAEIHCQRDSPIAVLIEHARSRVGRSSRSKCVKLCVNVVRFSALSLRRFCALSQSLSGGSVGRASWREIVCQSG